MQILLSILLMITAAFALCAGIYILYLNHNHHLHKLVYLISAALTLMAYGMERSLTAESMEMAVNWRRFSNAGTLFLYAFVLDFVYLKYRDELKKSIKIQRISIYVPAIFFIYLTSVSELFVQDIYHLQFKTIGYAYVPGNAFWDAVIGFYVAAYIIATFLVILLRIRKHENKKLINSRQEKILLLVFSMGTLYFIINQVYYHVLHFIYLQEIFPLFVPLPAMLLFYKMLKYSFVEKREEDKVMEVFRKRILNFLLVGYFLGGILYFSTQVFLNGTEHKAKVILGSSVLVFFAFTVFVAKKYTKSTQVQTIIFSILLTITVAFIYKCFEGSGVITVWAFPFIIIIASVMLYDSAVFIMCSTVTIIMMGYFWIFTPKIVVQLNETDHFGRIFLFAAAIYLIGYIRKIYMKRLQQLSEKNQDLDLLLQVSTKILDINYANKKDVLYEILEMIGLCWKAERIILYQKYKESYTGAVDSIVWDHYLLETTPELYQRKFVFLRVSVYAENIEESYLQIDFHEKSRIHKESMLRMMNTIANILGKAEDKNLLEIQKENMSFYDQLSGLPNRHLFEHHLEQWILSAKKKKQQFAVLFLDVDLFKNINDVYGHQFGDRVLLALSDRLQVLLTKEDVLCRFGGDEFLIMTNRFFGLDILAELIRDLLLELSRPIQVQEFEVNLTLSVGVALYPDNGSDKDTLIKSADIALFQAKDKGKNSFVFCSEKMKDELSKEMIIQNQLVKALEKNEFELVYQPQIQTSTKKIVAVEALLRWKNPLLGSVSPGVFIPIAEKSSVILAIGDYVLREACRQQKEFCYKGYEPIRVAVNISVHQLVSDFFAERVFEIIQESGIHPSHLELEITETAAMQESVKMIETLTKLHMAGISIAIDDFGIEYSSLTRIKDLPVDRIKLDIHFIRNLLHNEKERQVTEAIIGLANKLNLKVIAEGVEEEEQYQYLKKKKCDEIQGYFFYPPLPVQEIERLLEK